VALETRDAADGYLPPGTTVADLAKFPLEVEFLEIRPQAT
jgi:hypothetical protein